MMRFRSLGTWHRLWMFKKEAHHLAASVRATRLSVCPIGPAPRPSMTDFMEKPLLYDRFGRPIGINRTRIANASGDSPVRDRGSHRFSCPGMGSNLLAIDRMHCFVAVAMEDDRRHRFS